MHTGIAREGRVLIDQRAKKKSNAVDPDQSPEWLNDTGKRGVTSSGLPRKCFEQMGIVI